MKKFHFSHLLAVAVLALSFTFTSCDLINNLSKTNTVTCYYSLAPIGTWKSTNDSFTITNTDLTNYYAGSSTYAGNNLVIVPISDNAGTIFIKYTRSMNADWTYSETAPDVGKWYAVSYKNLTSSSVSLSGAWKSGGSTSTTTLEQAIAEFTIANGYFGQYTEYAKQ